MSEDALDRAIEVYRRLQLHHARLTHELASARGVNHTDLRFLFYLAVQPDGGILPKTATRYLGLSTGATTSLVDRLADRGLVRRVPNPDDRRSVYVTITDDGSVMVADVKDMFRDAFATAIPADRMEDFTTMLAAVDDALVARSTD
ncbi:MarR family winged helix-turn-helix transcriptional regulator [Curtobacterium sp. RRHDQ10]|uniref:MarR family winged helix-turn-helix transcriptional regulator n=1 Tax=Curtobacterium phyllosphaerae TaxID=3413379 RepID=UPI003BF3F14A